MEMKTSTGANIGGILGVAFIVLKLCHVIAWSWLWVLSPFWLPFLFVAIVLIAIGFVVLVAYIIDALIQNKW